MAAQMTVPRLSEIDRKAVASAAAAAALQLAQDFTFPMLDRDEFEHARKELRDGFLTVVAEVFPHEEGVASVGADRRRDQDPGRSQ